MNIFKKIGNIIATFFKTHTILAMILVLVIVLISIWTPVAVYLLKNRKDTQNGNITSNSLSQVTENSSYIVSGNEENNAQSDDKTSMNSSGLNLESNSKSENSTSVVTSSNSSSYTASKVETVKNRKKIICWGDSVTAGQYPKFLNDLLGGEYRVLNAGSCGEQSQTIVARQGALKVYTTQELVFNIGVATIDIGTDNNHSMCLEDGTMLDLAMDGNAFNNQVPSRTVYIDGKEYVLSIRANGSSVYEGIFELSRGEYDYSEKIVIPKGSEVVFSSALEQAKGTHCEIFLIGFNDSGNASKEIVDKVVERLKAMAKRQGNDNYIVIVNYHSSIFKEPIINAFGEKALDFGAEITEQGCYMAGAVKLTDLDIERINNDEVPPCLRLDNSPMDVHLNSIGEKYLATVIYEKGVKLGYWD